MIRSLHLKIVTNCVFRHIAVLRYFETSSQILHKNLSQKTNKIVRSFDEEINKYPDTFGNYSDIASKFDHVKDDPEDVKEKMRRQKMDRRSPPYYINVIKTHLDNHEFDKAVEVLRERMLKVDKVKPDSYVYDLLISYCGRIGNVREAFRLYNQVKKRNNFVSGGQYTSLFNACANSRNSKYALEIAHKIKKYLSADELHKPNIKNYNAMLKAFGRHGDLKTALEVMDEVLEKRGRVRDDTYNFLLQACIADSNSGFRHALLAWHKLLANKTDPTVFTFNLILRAVRDCGIGAPELLQPVIQNILLESSLRSTRKIKIQEIAPCSLPLSADALPLEEPDVEDSKDKPDENYNSKLITQEIHHHQDNALPKMEISFTNLKDEQNHSLPNLLAVRPSMGSVEELTSFSTAYHRLMLLGGTLGFLGVMDSLQIKPDMKTFTLLLEIIPSTKQAEDDLMNLAKMKKVSFDTAFFNMLIKKRSYRFDYNDAQDVLRLMQLNGVKADLITFGVLALSCRKFEDAQTLVASVHDAGFRLNSEILGPLVRQATYLGDLHYVRLILKEMKEDDVKPSPKLMGLLDDFMKKQKKALLDS